MIVSRYLTMRHVAAAIGAPHSVRLRSGGFMARVLTLERHDAYSPPNASPPTHSSSTQGPRVPLVWLYPPIQTHIRIIFPYDSPLKEQRRFKLKSRIDDMREGNFDCSRIDGLSGTVHSLSFIGSVRSDLVGSCIVKVEGMGW